MFRRQKFLTLRIETTTHKEMQNDLSCSNPSPKLSSSNEKVKTPKYHHHIHSEPSASSILVRSK